MKHITNFFNSSSASCLPFGKLYLGVMIILIILSPLSLHAQTAAEMDTLLQTEALSIAQTARFILGSRDLISQGLFGDEAEHAAYEFARSRGWVSKQANQAATLEDTAFLIMNAFEIRGGLMYRLFSNHRYAFRELIYLKLIEGRAYPQMTVSGSRLLQIITRTLVYTGETE